MLDDVSVVSFDDLLAAIVLDPFLTNNTFTRWDSVRRNCCGDQLHGKGLEDPQETRIPNELTIRQSSTPLRWG